MTELHTSLDAYLRGEGDLDSLARTLARSLQQAPETAFEARRLLDGALARGLTPGAHSALLLRIEQATRHLATPPPRDTESTDHGAALDTGLLLRGREAPGAAAGHATDTTRDTDRRAAVTTTGAFPSAQEGSREFGTGDRLRNRFELLSKLGEGGMGAVWKGKDLLKEEAKDRNPFVAIKLLQKNFKEHPDAFIALQRETAKQQRLAHPNVATVFSFDRDADSGAVFMTMDLLEGESLDRFIHNMPAGGLPEHEAMFIIKQLAAGLAYAHKHGLVHSDLKPGNCFLTRDRTVKLLDFGIARASKTKVDAEGVTTLFDPGELGAITPAYATVEMFEGMPPDPRDDIYALGIMAYQLLTGEHPYGKLSAPKAADAGLAPEPVAKLSKRQNRALARALSLERDRRTPSVERFVKEIQRKDNRRLVGIAASVAAVALIAALGYFQITDYLRQQENEAIIAVLEKGGLQNIAEGLDRVSALTSERQRQSILRNSRTVDAVARHIAQGYRHSIREGLNLVRPFPKEFQRQVREHEDARAAIIGHYEQRSDAAFNPARGRYDYDEASRQLDVLERLYPNSATVLTMRKVLDDNRQSAIESVSARLDELLAEGRLLAQPDGPDVGALLATLRDLDADHRLLSDPRLAAAYLQASRSALEADDLERAKSLVDAGIAVAPDDTELAALRSRIEIELEGARRARLEAESRARLAGARDALNTLADFRRLRDDLSVLATLRPNDAMLADLRWQLRQIFESEFADMLAGARWLEAESLLLDFAPFFTIADVAGKRGALEAALGAAGARLPASDERRARLGDRVRVLNKLLEAPTLTPEWEVEFETAYKEALTMIGADGKGMQLVRRTLALLYSDHARRAVDAKRFTDARDLISKGRRYDPSASALDEAERYLTAMQSKVIAGSEEKLQARRIERAQAELLAHVEAGRAEEADRVLAELLEDLPADHPYVVATAAPAVAKAYVDAAAASRNAGDLAAAVRAEERALAIVPGAIEIEAALARDRSELARREHEAELVALLRSSEPLAADNLQGLLDAYRRDYGSAEHARLVATLATLASERLLAQAEGRTLAGERLAGELETVRRLFADTAGELTDALGAALDRRASELAAQDAYLAHEYTTQALRVLPRRPALVRLLERLPPREIAQLRADLLAGRLNAARGHLQRARKLHPTHPDLVPLAVALDVREEEARAAYARYEREVRQRVLDERSEREAAYAHVMRLWSDNAEFVPVAYREPRPGECLRRLAGRGRSRDGVCFDLVDGGHLAIPMIVVPPGDGLDAPFAIGKYEVSTAEFNRYCEASGECEPAADRDPRLPATGISRDAAERFARWLSREASASSESAVIYRLPLDAEWRHAAAAAGSEARRGINCKPSGRSSPDQSVLVARNGTVSLGRPLGRSLVSVTFGEENGWGMVNEVGNAQEWVVTPDGLAARGGAFSDTDTRCRVAFARAHDGAPDPVTGFRLVREIE